MDAITQILRYLKLTPSNGIFVPKIQEDDTCYLYRCFPLVGSVTNRRLTPGYCIFSIGNLIIWRSNKQSMVVRLSVETKFGAMVHRLCELLWIKFFLSGLRKSQEGPMKLYYDNKLGISIAHNPVQLVRTKHIEVNHHFIKEKLDGGLVCTPYISSKRQLAKILTQGFVVQQSQTR